MKKTVFALSRAQRASLSIALLLGLFPIANATPPAKAEQKVGKQLFMSLCASCHGAQARGDGPVAALLVTPPPDLTRIAQRHGGFFPAVEVQSTIDGRIGRIVHGTRSMPVWGRQLYFSDKQDDASARARADEEVRLLAEYIRTLQQ